MLGCNWFTRNRAVPVLLGVIILAGCRDQQPPEEFNEVLTTDSGASLLPVNLGFHGARDARIRQGGRVTVFKLDEFDPSAVPADTGTITAGPTPTLEPAEGVTDALGKVGSAFLGNLLGGAPAADAGPGAAPDSAEAGTPPDTSGAGAGALTADDEQAIQALVDRFNTARSKQAFSEIAGLSVSTRGSAADEYYDKLEELGVSLTNLLDSYEKVQPGTQAAVAAQLTSALAPRTLADLAAQDADHARGALVDAAGNRLDVLFEREGGNWRIVDPFVPTEANAAAVMGALEAAITALDDLDNSMVDGQQPDEAAAQAAVSRALNLLAGGTQ